MRDLVFKIDRDGRATQYLHDHLGRTTAENWLAGNWLTADLSVNTITQGSGTNEVQRVGMTAGMSLYGGTFTLSFDIEPGVNETCTWRTGFLFFGVTTGRAAVAAAAGVFG